MAGSNAVAVVRVGAKGMRVAGLIPAGWYPSAVAASADGRTLYVANGKGNGSGANPDGTYIGNVISGSVSIIPVPDSAGSGDSRVRCTLESVFQCAPWCGPSDPPTVRPSSSNVVYIIRENRTYDQVFGDVARGNAMRAWRSSTTRSRPTRMRSPLAGLFDNFYVSGEVSADGHEWTTRAFAGDYKREDVAPELLGSA